MVSQRDGSGGQLRVKEAGKIVGRESRESRNRNSLYERPIRRYKRPIIYLQESWLPIFSSLRILQSFLNTHSIILFFFFLKDDASVIQL